MQVEQGGPEGSGAAAKLRAVADVVSQRLGDAGVLIDMRTGRMFELNASGIRIWELVTEGLSPQAVVSRLQHEFESTPADLEVEVRALVHDLVREGLLDVEPVG